MVEDHTAISDIVRNKDRHLWLDVEKPSIEDLGMIQEEFNFHHLAIEDAMMSHQRPKVEKYDNFYLVVFYSVAVVEPGTDGAVAGRRGLKGTRFHRPAGDDAARPNGSRNGKNGVALPRMGAEAEAQEDVDGDERIVLRELALFMGENFLVTVHNDPIPELDEAAKRWQRNIQIIAPREEATGNVPGTRPLTPEEQGTLQMRSRPGSDMLVLPQEDGKHGATDKPDGASHTQTHTNDIGILLYSLLDTIVDNYFPVMDSIVDRSEALEEQIFERYSQSAIEGIFTLKKDLLALRKVLAPERDVLNVLIRRDLPIFETHTLIYFQDVYDHVVRLTDSIDTYRDLLSSALDSFLSMQSNRLNITVQTLTAFSIILMSVAGVAGWYGMNFTNMPELNSAWGYPGVAILVVVIVALEVLFFKRKGWL
ncbi:MAG TPA: magnesium transporter CorA family protein [Chloroflexia bacterium]|nr:magnesium transporter CorA family protein [Chloroflexia bacterium]